MISPSDYLILANCVADYMDSLDASIELIDALPPILDAMVQDNVVDSKTPLRNTALMAEYSLEQIHSNPKYVVKAVYALQRHITTHYGTVNDFLSDNDIQVKPSFATVSALAGYAIDAENVD
jgi:hypothetical protein